MRWEGGAAPLEGRFHGALRRSNSGVVGLVGSSSSGSSGSTSREGSFHGALRRSSSSGSSGSTSRKGSFHGALPPEQIGWQPEHIGLREVVVVVVVWQY